MTWTRVATISDTDVYDRWRNFFDNHLSGITGWTVATSANDSNYRLLDFSYTDADDGTTQTDYFIWQNNYIYERCTYTTVPGDSESTSSCGRMSVDNEYTSPYGWTVWTSDENPGSIMMMEDMAINFLWLGHAERRNPTKQIWPVGNHNYDPVLYPIMERQSYFHLANYSVDPESNTITTMYPDCILRAGNQFAQKPTDEFFKEFSLMPSSSSTAPFVRYDDPDVVVKVPAGTIAVSQSTQYSDTGGVLFDGTSYWHTSSSSLTGCTILFLMGATEPVYD